MISGEIKVHCLGGGVNKFSLFIRFFAIHFAIDLILTGQVAEKHQVPMEVASEIKGVNRVATCIGKDTSPR